jgi:haloacetate dehalogenase
VLLLHGFPETHLMWRTIAPALAQRFTVVCADLRGYGRSGCPPSLGDHSPYAKRTMARDMVRLMWRLGHERFAVAGHDRGGRVSYRLALDYAECVTRLAALDVIPTEDAWARADHRLALAFWPWSLLAQPSPLPEALLTVGAEAIVDNALSEWGSASTAFPREVRDAYVAALKAPEHAQAICEEYRAAVSLDREHDRADLAIGRRITCPVLALWSGLGGLESWYAGEGGPLAIWRRWADRVTGHAIAGGHFFPEEHPLVTAKALADFFAA